MDEDQLILYNNSESYFDSLVGADEAYFKEYLDFIAQYARPGMAILDAGCGTGQSTEMLRRRGYAVIGVDGTERFINHAKQQFPEADIRLGDLLALPFPAASFDIVAMYNTLEHVTDVPKVLTETLRLLKPGGFLLIHSPNLLSAKHMLDAYRFRNGMTFEGEKSSLELLLLALRNIFWLIGRTIAHRPNFLYRKPNVVFEFPDNDATVYLNPVDVRLALESLGAKVDSYQSVKHLVTKTFKKSLGSRFFGDHMGIIRIAAKKGARYERH